VDIFALSSEKIFTFLPIILFVSNPSFSRITLPTSEITQMYDDVTMPNYLNQGRNQDFAKEGGLGNRKIL